MPDEPMPDVAESPAAPRRWVAVAARAVMVLFALGLPLAVLETALRMSSPDPNAIPPENDRTHVVMYPDPSRQHPWTRGETNVLRIGVIGDSVTQGVGVQPQDAYGERLEYLLNLNKGVRPAEVRVYAKSGTNARTQMKLLDSALADGVSLVIMGICMNDAESGGADLHPWRLRLVVGPPPRWYAPLERHSRVAAWIRQRLAHARINRVYYDYYRYLYETNQPGWGGFLHGVDLFRDACAARNVRLVAVIFPLMTDVDRKPYPFAPYHAKIGAALKERGIPFLDLQPPFLGKLPVRMQAFPGVDAHPSEIAQRMIAERLFAFLMETGLVDSAYAPVITDKGGQQSFWHALAGHPAAPGGEPPPDRTGAKP